MSFKSYVGRRTEPKKSMQEKVKVSDYMTRKIITFHPEQSVVEVIHTLLSNDIAGGPVINDENELVGFLSEGDCLKEISDCRYHNFPMEDIKVKDHMIKKVETVESDMNVFDAANKFLESKHRQFPVIEDGKLVGQISQREVLHAAMKLR